MAWAPAVQTFLQRRAGYIPRWFLYVQSLETDGSSAPLGVWSGPQDVTMTVAGETRTYIAGADGMRPDQITFEVGTTIRTQRINLNGVNAQAIELIQGRIIRGRRGDLYLGFYDPASEILVGMDRMFKGYVNKAPATVGARGESSRVTIELSSGMRSLTKPVSLKKSEHSQMIRAGDPIRKYSSIAANVKTEWGPGDRT